MEEMSPKADVVQQNGESVEKDYEPVEKTVTEYNDSPRSIEEDRSVFETGLRQEENENADDEDEQHWRRRYRIMTVLEAFSRCDSNMQTY